MNIIYSLAAGGFVGLVFGILHLTPPAPPTWAGVAGIVGIVAAWQIVGWLR